MFDASAELCWGASDCDRAGAAATAQRHTKIEQCHQRAVGIIAHVLPEDDSAKPSARHTPR
jgi:hypothetical protein